MIDQNSIPGSSNIPLSRLMPHAYVLGPNEAREAEDSGTLPRGGLVNSNLPNARIIRKVNERLTIK